MEHVGGGLHAKAFAQFHQLPALLVGERCRLIGYCTRVIWIQFPGQQISVHKMYAERRKNLPEKSRFAGAVGTRENY